jgi:cellulose synthase/poly-beta-1,6-N-acetylglucosamine synthase-like glycosyltransferase
MVGMLSLIIPCQEDAILLFPTLKSIFSNDFAPQDFEVLLICSDKVPISEKNLEFPVQVYSGVFRGQAQALNWGLERARGDVVCTTKPGCVVASNWLSEITRFLQHNPEVDCVGGRVLPCWEYGTKIQKIASQIFSEEQGFSDSVTILKPSAYQGLVHATNSAFRKEVLNSTKFDECFKYDYDFDICWKLVQKGHCIAYNPEMKVQYIFPLSMRDLLKRYYYWGKENMVLRKKYSDRERLKTFLYMPYATYRSLLQPPLLVSRKKMLRFVQHAEFNVGCLRGIVTPLKPCAVRR